MATPSGGHADKWQGKKRVTTQQEYFQTHAVDGELSPEHTAQMLTLPEGDTPIGASATPGADATDDTGKTTVEATQKDDGGTTPAGNEDGAGTEGDQPKVILAKDGVHTIPYDRLDEARKGEQAAKERAAELERQLEAERAANKAAATTQATKDGTTTGEPPAATTAPKGDGEQQPGATTVDPAIFGDYSDDALAKGIEKLVEMRVAPLKAELERVKGTVAPVEQQRQIDATEAHFSAIYKAHPNLDSMLESTELEGWITSQPSFARDAYRQTLEKGTATEVIEMFDAFTKATGRTQGADPAAGQDPAAQAAAKAAAAVAAARTAPPSSLSEIPAGSSAHHDESAAMLEMTPEALMTKLEGKTPEQINALLSRAL